MLTLVRRIPSSMGSPLLRKFQVTAPNSQIFFSTSAPRILVYDYLVNRHHFSPQSASNASASSPAKFLLKPQNADSVLSFLAASGFSTHQIETLVQKFPKILSAKLEGTVKPKIKVFQDLGFHSNAFADIISAKPFLLHNRADKLRRLILVLQNVLGPHVDICRFLKNSGTVWTFQMAKKLVTNMEYLKSSGFCPFQIVRHACNYPGHLLAINPNEFKVNVGRVEEMGVLRDSKMFLYALKVMCSMSSENWELKLKLFRDLGFSEQNILHAFRVTPTVFALSVRKIKEATQLLSSATNISYITNKPQLLTYSVEKRLKPRLRVLKALESKNMLKKRPALYTFVHMADSKFRAMYVSPYLEEVGDLYAGKQCL